MEIVLIIVGVIFVVGIIGAVLYIISMIFLSIVAFLSFTFGVVIGITASFKMFGIWLNVAKNKFHTPFQEVFIERNKLISSIEKEYKGSVRSFNWEEFEHIEKGGRHTGYLVSFEISSFLWLLILSGVYLITYSLYYLVFSLIFLAVGCLLPIVYISYIYWKAIIVRRVFFTINITWKNNMGLIKGYHQKQKDTKRNWLPNVELLMLVTYQLMSYLIFIVNISIHTLLFLLISPFVLLIFLIVFVIEKWYMSHNKISTICPSCLHKMKIPDYQCNHCSTIHHNVHPRFIHIFHKKCDCGSRHPVSLSSGRNEHMAICNQCQVSIENKENRPISIPVIGGPSVGKTTFVISTLTQYIHDATINNLKVKFASRKGERNYLNNVRKMNQGIFPEKTVVAMPMDFNLLVTHGKRKPDTMISMYDFAGEIYDTSKNIAQYKVFEYFDGLVFIIDPFSIKGVVNRYKSKQGFKDIRASKTNLNETFDVMVLYLERHFGISPKQKVKKPCTFIICKLDAFDLNEQIGNSAIENYIKNNPRKKSDAKLEHMLCKKFLEENGEQNLVMRIEHKFKNYQFFACSSVIKPTQERAKGTLEPFKWLLDKV